MRLLLTLDDELSKVLEGKTNKSETIRDALRVYNEHISTGTLESMRQSFMLLRKDMNALQARFIEQYELVERMYTTLEEFKNR